MNGAVSLNETKAIGHSRFIREFVEDSRSTAGQRLANTGAGLGWLCAASAKYENASRSMKPPIDNVIDRAAITIVSRIHGALRLYSLFIALSIGLSDQANGSCAERHRKSVDKS